MPNISAELPAVNSEWLETVEKLVRLGPAALATLSKVKAMLPKRGGPKRDLKQLASDIDHIIKVIETITTLFGTHVNSNKQLVEALVKVLPLLTEKVVFSYQWAKVTQTLLQPNKKIAEAVVEHQARIKALEAALAIKAKRGKVKPSPALTGAKTQKKAKAKRVK